MFLEEALVLNERNISVETRNKVRKLINELRQPTVIKPLDIDKYYVVYRCDRAFTSSIYKPVGHSIIHSNVSYVECRNENVAYYYTTLQYLIISHIP